MGQDRMFIAHKIPTQMGTINKDFGIKNPKINGFYQRTLGFTSANLNLTGKTQQTTMIKNWCVAV
jgi:hypothetical protein